MSQVERALPIVLVAGWGVPAEMLSGLFDGWPSPVHLVSLDAELVGDSPDVETLAARLTDRYTEPALWVGWSLGGQVAMAAADRAPDRVQGVLTLCSFPRFVATADWPYGMAQAQFQRFSEDLQRDARRCRQRFLTLQALGDPDELEAKRALRPWLRNEAGFTPPVLQRTLDWLAHTDQRRLWQSLELPVLHLWGECDRVVSGAMAGVPVSSSARVARVAGLTHWPRGHALDRCRQALVRFVEQCQEVA
ncbi:MAG: alpha/beta fold hydrolase [Marinobacter sp.]|uniref:alpha/beta fold hydrolase n=1 Tax=Marinobacter sp. TaxID=50741 RepID=UPI00299E791D|nr:alpha/beta fold hydrolase [Marinobacter sp.]MDX1756767.1 alpha/beta fold hydrolase [Marinobacter sp.]